MVAIYDNWLPEPQFEEITKLLLSPDMDAWRLSGIIYQVDRPYNHQMTLNPMEYGTTQPLLQPVIDNFDCLCWLRVKANITFRTHEHNYSPYHVDVHEDLCIPNHTFTGILYLNTNNGFTKFSDGTKVDCVANRYVEFPAETEHAGVTTTDTDYKALINFNYVRKTSLWQKG